MKNHEANGCGGILSDNNGSWKDFFPLKYLGICQVAVAYLWGALEGLTFTYDKGYKGFELHIDNLEFYTAITSDYITLRVGLGIIHRNKSILKRKWEIRMKYIFREPNICADGLASMGANHTRDFQVFDICLAETTSFIFSNLASISHHRIYSL